MTWGGAMNELHTLEPGIWIGVEIMDFFLSNQFANLPASHPVVYIPYNPVRFTQPPTADEIAHFSTLFNTQTILSQSIIFIVWRHDHYFLALFDYMGRRVITYGRKFNNIVQPVCQDLSWLVWRGPELWNRISALCGHPNPPPPLDCKAVQWKQVSKISLLFKHVNSHLCQM